MLLDTEVIKAVEEALRCVDDDPRRVFHGHGENNGARKEIQKNGEEVTRG